MTALVLASASVFRRAMLESAGLDVVVEPARIDERAVEATLAGLAADDIALVLAEAKALEVSARRPGDLVLGCDQTLALGDRLFHKPADMEAARRTLLALEGRTHQLHSAAVLARDGTVLWRTVRTADMTMRPLTPDFIGRHLASVGPRVLGSVGAYQIEGAGIQLFETVEGDHFTIVGLPLLPLLAALRDLDAIDG